MSENIRIKASDGHELNAYVSRPETPIAGLVVLQEAFGVNHHIRSVADRYANDGFLAIAPALYDRIQPGFEVGYGPEDREKGIAVARKANPADAVKDVAGALAYLREQGMKKSGVIGYCFGGTIAWLSATRLDPDAAVGYYGGYIGQFAQENPHCPVMLHFGSLDKHIPREEVDKVQQAHPDVQIFWYAADHGFNCDERSSYNADAARQARERSLQFLQQNLT